MTSFYNLLKYAATGIASPDMTYYDRMRASTLMGGAVKTLTGIPPLSFKADGSPLISWSMKGNGSQQGTPTPDNPVMPEFVGVRTGNMLDESTSSDADATHVNYNKSKPIYLLAGQSYTFSCDTVCNGLYIRNSTDDSTLASANSAKTLTYTPAANVTAYLRVWNSNSVTNLKPMLNLGSTALPYEPFGWAEKFTCSGQTVPVYLGQVSTVRRVKKQILTGMENVAFNSRNDAYGHFVVTIPAVAAGTNVETNVISTHLKTQTPTNSRSGISMRANGVDFVFGMSYDDVGIVAPADASTIVTACKAYLTQQYAAGHPVTIWYVLATPETAIVNEPLAKIGDYADELSSEDAAVTIPTVKGNNTLTVESELQPSEMTITFKG